MSKEEGRRWAERIIKLDPNAKARFGKMTVAEMVVHCRLQFEATWAAAQPKPVGQLSRTFMKVMVLSGPWPKGKMPTSPPWDMATNGLKPGTLAQDAKALVASADRFAGGSARQESRVIGLLAKEDWVKLQRRHLGHHLSQFRA